MPISDRLCCCMDVATGSLLSGIYTLFLSLAFLAVGIDSLVETYRGSHNNTDFVTLSAVYGLLIGLSALYGIASVSLVLGASGKHKTYVISWVVLTPLWSVVAFCVLVVLPLTVGDAVALTNSISRICGTAFVMAMNIFCMVCVCVFLATLIKKSPNLLKSMGVVEALETGFSNGYSRLRESVRRPKSKAVAKFSNRSSAQPPTVTLPDVKVAVVLDPKSLESPHSEVTRNGVAYSQFVNETGEGA